MLLARGALAAGRCRGSGRPGPFPNGEVAEDEAHRPQCPDRQKLAPRGRGQGISLTIAGTHRMNLLCGSPTGRRPEFGKIVIGLIGRLRQWGCNLQAILNFNSPGCQGKNLVGVWPNVTGRGTMPRVGWGRRWGPGHHVPMVGSTPPPGHRSWWAGAWKLAGRTLQTPHCNGIPNWRCTIPRGTTISEHGG